MDDPPRSLAGFEQRAVFDEEQRRQDAFSRLPGIGDRRHMPGGCKPGLAAESWVWRDNAGLDADRIFAVGTRIQPMKIRSGQTLTRDYLQAGQASAGFAGNEALSPWPIHGGSDSSERSGVRVMGWRDLAPAYVSAEWPLS
ncbi:hypothetical protein [Accumulibacter sp.]|uniref:hypothetical protein n=1 Tax=Accumulibacter sp. TaxID=2053492 RepID=UPI002C813C0F|nr:hypothetical protein [Accumulibacter sp.]HRF03340.1 hypothetical protein [Accumulibacter sp.]